MATFKDLMSSSDNLLKEIKGSSRNNSRSSNEQSGSLHYSGSDPVGRFDSSAKDSVTTFHYRVYQVLAPDGFEWDDIIVNLFMPSDIPQTAPVGSTVILHGHTREKSCFTPTFCHVLGYVPKDGGSKFWKMKWGTTLSATFVANPFGQNRQVE